MPERLFGTDGIRGAAGVYPLDPKTVTRIGRALAAILRERTSGDATPRVLLGRDTRASGPSLEAALSAGLVAGGAEVVSGGVLPTPAVAWLLRDRGFAAGAVLSASHNPAGDNGIKLFSGDGFKLGDERERAIERAVAADAGPVPAPAAAPFDDALAGGYSAALGAAVPGLSLAGRTVVIDCANGAASGFAPELFRSLGAEVHAIACAPDGDNINPEHGATPHAALRAAVRERRAFLGCGFDGDADRCVLVDADGELRDGDDILAIAATAMQRSGGFKTVVSTVMANFGLERYLDSIGVALHRTKVGDRHVLEAMRAHGAALGGEQSGHVIFLDHATTGDGMLTALKLAEIVVRSDRSLAALASCWTRMPQTLSNVRVGDKVELDTVPAVRDGIAEAQQALAGRGRVLVRYSGTEPVLRIMLEGPDRAELERLAAGLTELVRAELS